MDRYRKFERRAERLLCGSFQSLDCSGTPLEGLQEYQSVPSIAFKHVSERKLGVCFWGPKRMNRLQKPYIFIESVIWSTG